MIGRNYAVQVRFDYAGGVTKDTPVRKSGILIGRVSDVQLTDHDSKVLVTLKIQSDKTIYQNEDCYITRDLLGDTRRSSSSPTPESRAPGEPIAAGHDPGGQDLRRSHRAEDGPWQSRSTPSRIPAKALTAASKKLGEAADRVEDILDPETQKNVQVHPPRRRQVAEDHPGACSATKRTRRSSPRP